MILSRRLHLIVILLTATCAISRIQCTFEDVSAKDIAAPVPLPVHDLDLYDDDESDDGDFDDEFPKFEDLKETPPISPSLYSSPPPSYGSPNQSYSPSGSYQEAGSYGSQSYGDSGYQSSNYTVSSYQPVTQAHQSSYSTENYSTQSYQAPVSYSSPSYPPQESHSQPSPVSSYQPPAYQTPVTQTYSQPQDYSASSPYPSPIANYSAPAYPQPAPVSSYQAPPVQQTYPQPQEYVAPPAYQAPVANYSAPTYHQPQPILAAYPQPAPVSSYQAPPVQQTYPQPQEYVAPPAYQAPVANYSAPTYHQLQPILAAYPQPAPVSSYQAPTVQQTYGPPQEYAPSAYQASVANYSAPAYPQPSSPSYQQPAQASYQQPAPVSSYQAPPVQQTYPQPQEYVAPPAYQAPVANYSAPAYQPQQAPASYQQPEPVSSYQSPPIQKTYQQPQEYVAPPAYQDPPVANYSAPSYAPPQVSNYLAPAHQPQPAPATYQQPGQVSTYQAPPVQQAYPQPQEYVPPPSYQVPVANYSAPSIQPPAVQQTYSKPQEYSTPPVYQAPQVSNYSTLSYQLQPATQAYQQPAPIRSYQAQPVQQAYVNPQEYTAPTTNYSSPSQGSSYQAPAPPKIPVMSTYSAPSAPSKPSYKPVPLPPVQKPYQLAPVVSNYTKPVSYASKPAPIPQKPASYAAQKPTGNQISMAPKYQQVMAPNYSGMGNLNSLVNPIGYKSNHWSLYYYRMSPYMICPKGSYLSWPSPQDIARAFELAQKQLLDIRGNTISYINSTHHSFASRHAQFHYLSQKSPRMDEEGLLIEAVSQYLASRTCMTKWDKQRYLPQLTKFLSTGNYPASHSCATTYLKAGSWNIKQCAQSKYRTIDGFCNNIYHPYWGKSNVCHIRLLSPDYADGISAPRVSYNPAYPLPNPRAVSNIIHHNVPLEGLYNLMKMQWGQFINHDITNTALSSYDGLVDCCKNPSARGCWPIYVPPGDPFYSKYNVTCLSFIRSGVCPLCQLGPRQQSNKNTAFLDASHIYGNAQEQANKLRVFKGGLLITSSSKNGEAVPPVATGPSQDQCAGICYVAGDNRINQHPALTALHTLLLRRHNQHAIGLARRHPQWNDEILFQEARRITIAEYQMITYGEYMPIVFGPMLSAYYKLIPNKTGYTYYNPKVDPTTWNEYSTAACRFGHSQISSTFGLYNKLIPYRAKTHPNEMTFRMKDWFLRPSFIDDGLTSQLVMGLLGKAADVVDPWISDDVREHLYKSHKDPHGGDLAATNIQRGREHGLAAYVHYLEYCFNYKAHGWDDLKFFIPPQVLADLRKVYKVVENIDLFTGGLSERHFPGADIGPTFACINGIQYYHLKFGDRYYFEHGGQAGSFTPLQLDEIRRSTLARLLCKTAYLTQVPYYAFLQVSHLNPIANCSQLPEIDYNKF